ncbi:MAG TPA: 50S ribosomal protein L11 methyltransferase [Puia sp.]|nr:50S ribosomal protein L11 methyltransferase [Puia sp.]
MTYVEVDIPASAEAQEVLIALLSHIGYEGFEQEETRLRAFVTETQFDEIALAGLMETQGLRYSIAHLGEKNWNEEWEKNYRPVVIEGFCAVRAHFHEPIGGVMHELVITPKMSFGTGHHATTFLMLKAMGPLPMQGRRVLDFGTGTGVLAILAEQLGAEHVLAVDCDDWSISNACENVGANGCTRIAVEKADTIAGLPGPFDVILANINKHVILRELRTMAQQLAKGGVILLSGLLRDDLEDIENQAAANNLSISERTTKENWIALKTERMK